MKCLVFLFFQTTAESPSLRGLVLSSRRRSSVSTSMLKHGLIYSSDCACSSRPGARPMQGAPQPKSGDLRLSRARASHAQCGMCGMKISPHRSSAHWSSHDHLAIFTCGKTLQRSGNGILAISFAYRLAVSYIISSNREHYSQYI